MEFLAIRVKTSTDQTQNTVCLGGKALIFARTLRPSGIGSDDGASVIGSKAIYRAQRRLYSNHFGAFSIESDSGFWQWMARAGEKKMIGRELFN